jgi:GxxExxY protein
MEHKNITHKIIGCAYTVHNKLGAGFLEKVYENALRIELLKNGFEVKQQFAIEVFYDNQVVGDYVADLLVNNQFILELKAVEVLHSRHEVQLVNYLNGTGLDIGILINFGSSVEVKRKYRKYKKV